MNTHPTPETVVVLLKIKPVWIAEGPLKKSLSYSPPSCSIFTAYLNIQYV